MNQKGANGNGREFYQFLRNAMPESGMSAQKKELLIEFWNGFYKFAIIHISYVLSPL